MKSIRDLTIREGFARVLLVAPLALAGMGLLAYGDTRGIAWMVPLGAVLFGIAFVVVGLVAYHGFSGPVGRGSPMPPRRDGSRGTSEEDDAEREQIRTQMRRTQRRALTVFPVAAVGVVLGILGEQRSSSTLSTVGGWVFGVGFVLFAVAVMSGTLPMMRRLWTR